MGLGVPVGYSPEVLRSLYDVPGPGTVANIGVSIVQESLALLTLGLVRCGGEVAPQRLPSSAVSHSGRWRRSSRPVWAR
jgi:hypothetical protein